MKVRFGLLYRGHKIVVPKRCREKVLNHVHNSTHVGVQRTYEYFTQEIFLERYVLGYSKFLQRL